MSTQVLISCFVSCWLSVLAVLTAPASADEIEQPAIRDTAYPIPPDAVFVAPNGKDRNPGTKRAPLLTIGAAMELAPSGGTIVIRRGTYRESLPDLAKPLTFQPYPHEKVWLKGSIPVTGWVREGKFWRKDGWSPGFCRDCYHPDNIDPQYPNAGQPDQVFVDGAPLKQVSSRKELGPGTFLVDDEATRLYIAIRPTGRLVEASVHGTALTVWQNGKGSVIRGLGFAHYAPVATHGAAATLKLSADDIRFENNTVAWSSVKGLEVFGRNTMIRGNTFIHNGWIGLAAWKAHDLTVTGNRFAHNNREMFVRTGHIAGAAGASITNTKHALVSDNLFDSNHSNGLWFDQNVTQATVVRNIMRNNLRHGLFYEISSHGLIASNTISNSGSTASVRSAGCAAKSCCISSGE